MSKEQIICDIKSTEETRKLFEMEIVNDDGRKKAEEIIKRFKDDKYIFVYIEKESLIAHAKYPEVIIDCRTKGMKYDPTIYRLKSI